MIFLGVEEQVSDDVDYNDATMTATETKPIVQMEVHTDTSTTTPFTPTPDGPTSGKNRNAAGHQANNNDSSDLESDDLNEMVIDYVDLVAEEEMVNEEIIIKKEHDTQLHLMCETIKCDSDSDDYEPLDNNLAHSKSNVETYAGIENESVNYPVKKEPVPDSEPEVTASNDYQRTENDEEECDEGGEREEGDGGEREEMPSGNAVQEQDIPTTLAAFENEENRPHTPENDQNISHNTRRSTRKNKGQKKNNNNDSQYENNDTVTAAPSNEINQLLYIKLYPKMFENALLRAIRSYPAIWCNEHTHYFKIKYRCSLWQKLVETFSLSSMDIRAQWKRIRTKYVKAELRLSQGKKYFGYFDISSSFLINRNVPPKKWVPLEECDEIYLSEEPSATEQKRINEVSVKRYIEIMKRFQQIQVLHQEKEQSATNDERDEEAESTLQASEEQEL